MNEIECNVITLENGIEYAEMLRLKSNNNVYVLLSNIDDPTDFYIRKVIYDSNEEKVVKIDNKKEYELAVSLFLKTTLN